MRTETARRALSAATIAEAFRITVEERPDVVAVRTVDDAVALTWSQLRDRADALAGGLARLGVRKGDTVALMLTNRPEFHVADLATMTLGAASFSLYQTMVPEQIAYVVGDAGAKAAIVEGTFADRFAAANVPGLETVIALDGGDGIPIEDVADPDFDAEAAWRVVQPEDLLTLIYTSGTTGPPKGVQLVHRNLMAECRAIVDFIELPEEGRVISWLPAAHVAERVAHHYIPVVYGLTVTCCPNPREVVAYLPRVRPSWFFAVPRIWEKLKAGLEAMLAGAPEAQREALAAAIRKVELEQAGEPVPDELAAAVARADAEMFARLRENLGLDQAAAVNVGAAPTAREVIVFFHALGIPLAELWGMSETCGAGTVNPLERIKIGTVGPPLPGVEIKVADDGEVLVRSDVVMTGYRNLPELTAEALGADGWLRTGDIGEIDADGYLTLVDRKKELIIGAGGKNMSPANIEATLKGASPLIGHACAIGDSRPYNTALIVLDADFAPAWAARHGLDDAPLDELARADAVREAIQGAVDAANAKLARVEQIKRFTLIEGDWAPGGDELTPTMKLRRKPIAAKYAAAIDRMYAG